MKTTNTKNTKIMTVMLYRDKWGAQARVTYHGGYHREYEGKNLAKVFGKMPKTVRRFCLNSDTKNRYDTRKYGCYSIHFWENI